MIRSFMLSRKDEYQPGQIVKSLDQSPSAQKYDRFKIIKMTRWHAETGIGEFQVKPVDLPKDPNNLKGWVR